RTVPELSLGRADFKHPEAVRAAMAGPGAARPERAGASGQGHGEHERRALAAGDDGVLARAQRCAVQGKLASDRALVDHGAERAAEIAHPDLAAFGDQAEVGAREAVRRRL